MTCHITEGCPILSTRFYRKKNKFYLIDSFYLTNRDFLGRSARKSFLSAICISLATLKNISRYSGTRVEACLFDRFVLLGEWRIFWTIRQVEFSICYLHLISDTIFRDILGPGWKHVYLIDSFYLANKECFLSVNSM